MFLLNENALEVFNNETAELENRVEEYDYKMVSHFQKFKGASQKEITGEEQPETFAALSLFKKAA